MKAWRFIKKILALLLVGVLVLCGGSLFMQNTGGGAGTGAETAEPAAIAASPEAQEPAGTQDAPEEEPILAEPPVAPEPTPEPVVTVSLLGQDYPSDTAVLDLSGRGRDAILSAADALGQFTALERVILGSEGDGLGWDDIARIHSAAPDAALDYGFTLYGTAQNLAEETLNLSHVPVGDRGEAVKQVLPYMTRCTYLDMDSCGVGHEDMYAIRQAFPGVNVVWRVWIGKYCDGCRYLDLGHNESLTNIEFVRGMPNLEVAVIAMNPIRDLSPLADCPHLEYLETQTTSVTDLSPLANLKELRHLNICKLEGLTDISPLYNLPDLMRLWIGCVTPIPAEQVAKMQEIAPACEIDTSVFDPTTGNWRITGYIKVSLPLYADAEFEQEVFHPRYYLLQEQFGYQDQDFAFARNDPLY